MQGRPELPDEAPSTQEIVEKVSEISDILFRAPHAGWSYLVILGAPQLLLPLFWKQLDPVYWMAALKAVALFSVPGVVAAAGAHRFAKLLGGTFNRRRSGFLAASVTFFILIITSVGYLVSFFRPNFAFTNALIGALAYSVVIHVIVLFVTSDHRHFRSALVSLLHPVSTLVVAAYLFDFGGRDWTIATTLILLFLLTALFFLDLVDAPVRRTTGVSFSLMFRYYIDHVSKGTLAAETLFDKTAGEIDALVAVASFRTEKGVKCGLVVPAVHPGPIGEIGGSNLPTKIAQTVGLTPNILVPHGSATHDFNPISTGEVERLGEAARRLFDTMPYSRRASPLVRAGEDAQVCAQFLGDGVLLTYTSWPRPIDDVDYGVGEAARMAAMAQGAHDAAFIDAHNSLELGSGAVWPSTRRAIEIQHRAAEATSRADAQRTEGIRAGYAQTKDAFSERQGIGDQGCQVIVTEIGGRRSAYVLWDGNNMLPEVRGKIRTKIHGLVDDFEVMTTDNHSVNVVTGGYNPVGYRADVERIAQVTKETLVASLADLEEVEVGLKTTRVPGLRVFGHWNTIRFIAAVQTIVSTIPRTAATMLIMHALLAVMVFLIGRWL
jgi:putative membrane protein